MSSDLIGRRRASEQRLDRARSLELTLKEKVDILVATTGMPIEQLDFDGSFRAALTALAAVAARRTHFDVIVTLPDAPFAMRIQHVNNAVNAEVLIQRDGPFEPVSDPTYPETSYEPAPRPGVGPRPVSYVGTNPADDVELPYGHAAYGQAAYGQAGYDQAAYEQAAREQATYAQSSYPAPHPASAQPTEPVYSAPTSWPPLMSPPIASPPGPSRPITSPPEPSAPIASPPRPSRPITSPPRPSRPASSPSGTGPPAPAAPLPSPLPPPSNYTAFSGNHSESPGISAAPSSTPATETTAMVQVASDLAELLWQGVDDMPS